MSWLNLLGIAVGLAIDALAVSIVAGLTVEQVTPCHTFRIAFHFGLFQFLMPILGWLGGNVLAAFLESGTTGSPSELLGLRWRQDAVGSRQRAEPRRKDRSDPRPMLVTLSIATSIDALAVGLAWR